MKNPFKKSEIANGLIINENNFRKLKQFGFQQMKEFTTDDVFIIGYPKSGNTLLQHLIAHLVFGLREEASKSLINSCVTEFYNNPYFFRHDKRHFFKSHEKPSLSYKNVIYVIRDGREAIRSYYYMMRNLGNNVSLEDLYKSGGEIFIGNWADHVKVWTENVHNSRILFVRYEDLRKNKYAEIGRICDFLGIQRSNEEKKYVEVCTSFENMKKMENSYSWKRSKSFKTWVDNSEFVREGSTQGYKSDDKIDLSWIKTFEERSFDMLSKFGYIS